MGALERQAGNLQLDNASSEIAWMEVANAAFTLNNTSNGWEQAVGNYIVRNPKIQGSVSAVLHVYPTSDENQPVAVIKVARIDPAAMHTEDYKNNVAVLDALKPLLANDTRFILPHILYVDEDCLIQQYIPPQGTFSIRNFTGNNLQDVVASLSEDEKSILKGLCTIHFAIESIVTSRGMHYACPDIFRLRDNLYIDLSTNNLVLHNDFIFLIDPLHVSSIQFNSFLTMREIINKQVLQLQRMLE